MLHDVCQAISAPLPGASDAHCGASGVFIALVPKRHAPKGQDQNDGSCVMAPNQLVPLSSL
jgi:hypothetical protein